jgi:hypothetical protein
MKLKEIPFFIFLCFISVIIAVCLYTFNKSIYGGKVK